uniref:VWFA domain-containing protein n=1 Tax=Panagrellus redivivus TaxID=6233 RepID=A0A7E4W6U9_PANRE
MRLLPAIAFLCVVGYVFADIVEIIEEGSGEEEIITKESDFDDELLPNIQQSIPLVVTSAENLTDSSPITTTVAPSSTPQTGEECLPKLDLVFLLDTSGSLEQIYQEHVRWAVSLVDSLQIEPDAVQVAAVQYAGFPLTEFALGTYPTVEDIRAHLQQINFQSGVTRTGYALRKAEAELFREERGARKDALKVIILFTDGLSIDDPLKPAAQLREIKGVKIYVVSVGTDGFESEMSRIAGNKENVFGPNDLPRLRSAVLNDAERARACSQIGPSWLRRNKVTNKPTGSPAAAKILKEGILPPLDFLNLVEDDSDDSEDISNEKDLASATKPSVDFDVDVKTSVLMTDDEKQSNGHGETVAPEVPVDGSADAAVVSNVESTLTPTAATEAVKIEATINSIDVAEHLSQNDESTTPTVLEITETEAIKIDESDNEALEKAIKEEAPVARAFAAPSFNQIVPESDEQHNDVFDLNEEERKSFSMTTPSTTTTSERPRTRETTTTRRADTVETTSTSTLAPSVSTSSVKTTKRIFTTRAKPTTTTPSTTTASASTPLRRIRTTVARKALSTVAASPTTTTTQRPRTTRRPTTTQSPSTTPVSPSFTTPRRRPTTRFPPRLTPNASGQCPMDVLFVVDSSGSVQKIYDEQKEYLMDIFSKAQIGDQHRVSLLQFAGSNVQKTEWSFDAIKESAKLMRALRQVRLITGTTYIGAALDSALQVLEKRRHNVPVIVVLISDGSDVRDLLYLSPLAAHSVNVKRVDDSIDRCPCCSQSVLYDLCSKPVFQDLEVIFRFHSTKKCTRPCPMVESMLTGESVPVTKVALPDTRDDEDTLSFKEHSKHILFCGTQVLQTRYYNDKPVDSVVLRAAYSTFKGQLVRSISRSISVSPMICPN